MADTVSGVFGVALIEQLDDTELAAMLADEPAVFADTWAVVQAQLVAWEAATDAGPQPEEG